VPCEGEHDNGTVPMTTTLQLGSQCNKQKREGKDPPSVNKDETERILRKQVPVNYRKLDNPFLDEEDLDETHNVYATTILQAILGTDSSNY
jgi:hypothetical protein